VGVDLYFYTAEFNEGEMQLEARVSAKRRPVFEEFQVYFLTDDSTPEGVISFTLRMTFAKEKND